MQHHNIFMRFLSFLLVGYVFFLSACTVSERDNTSRTSHDLKRASPIYLQWQESHSCLHNIEKLSTIVSASSLAWRHSSSFSNSLPVHTWLKLSPLRCAWSGSSSFFAVLQELNLLRKTAELGIEGIYLSGILENSDIHKGETSEYVDGQNACSFEYSSFSGNESEYLSLLKGIQENQLAVASQLIPSALYAGSDFSLALRNVRSYPGLFAMMEIPKTYWDILPNPQGEEYVDLPRDIVNNLSKNSVLPAEFFADSFSPSGWAATSEILGVDGVTRRWAYRWFNNPEFPVLHWDDPSGTARQLINAHLIQQVGLRHNLMVGWCPWAMAGLDVKNRNVEKRESTLEPALSAVHHIAGNAHRYGASLYIEDIVSPDNIKLLQETGADLIRDSLISPAIVLSILKKDAAEISNALYTMKSLSIDERRIMRETEVLLPSSSMDLSPEWQKRLFYKGKIRINVPTASLLAFAPSLIHRTLSIPNMEKIERSHLLMLAIHAFLPGSLLISPADLQGVIPAEQEHGLFPAVVSLDGSTASKRGFASGFSLYTGNTLNNFQEKVKKIFTTRNSLHVAEGRLEKIIDGKPGFLAFIVSLPDSRRVLFMANFSDKVNPLHAYPLLKQYIIQESAASNSSFPTSLEPLEWKMLVLKK